MKPGIVSIISLTYCPYCDKAKSLLKSLGVNFKSYEVDFLEYPEDLNEEFHSLSGIRTYPKNFIGDISIGGFDNLSAALKSGKLYSILESQGIQYKKPSF